MGGVLQAVPTAARSRQTARIPPQPVDLQVAEGRQKWPQARGNGVSDDLLMKAASDKPDCDPFSPETAHGRAGYWQCESR